MSAVIRVQNLSKKYRLGVINRRMLVDQIESWVARKLGRPDPHSSVFEHATDRMPTQYDFWALKDVCFEIEQGDIVGIMGRNGSGKSTLLKILSRVTAPTEGSAMLKGRLCSLLEVGTGFNYELTGRDNVFLNGSILGLKEREIRDRYERIVDFAEIEDFMDTPVKRYSSGMRVRLAFAVAAHLDPELLILDEVLAVGDAKFQEKCLNRIGEIKDSGVTVLFVSHSVESIEKLCTSAILLDEGKLVAKGGVAEVTQRYLGDLGMKSAGGLPPGMPESRHGLRCGRIAEILLEHLQGGRLVFGVPVETQSGHVAVDVGWVSSARLSTLRTEPSWSAAPDVSVMVVSNAKSPAQAETDAHHLLHAGAKESWVFYPNGRLSRYKEPNATFLTPAVQLKITDA